MAGTREEAIEKYFDALEKHVSLTMREKTDITKLMKTKGQAFGMEILKVQREEE